MGNLGDLKQTFNIMQKAVTEIKEGIENGISTNTAEHDTLANDNSDSYGDSYTSYEEQMKQHEMEQKRKKAAPKVIKFIIIVWIASIVLPILLTTTVELVGVFGKIKHVSEAIKESGIEVEKTETGLIAGWEKVEDDFREEHDITTPAPSVDTENIEHKDNVATSTEQKESLADKFDFEFKSSYVLAIVAAVVFGIVLVLILRKVTTKKEVIYDGFNYTVKDMDANAVDDTPDMLSSDNLNDNITDTEDTE